MGSLGATMPQFQNGPSAEGCRARIDRASIGGLTEAVGPATRMGHPMHRFGLTMPW